MTRTDKRLLLLNDADNILVLTSMVEQGEDLAIEGQSCTANERLGMGHKLARRDIAVGEPVLKYGMPIGFASKAIPRGNHVHVHNLRSGYTTVELME